MLYYCLHKFHKLPHEILALPQAERAFIYAAIELKVKQDKKAMQDIKRRRR